MAKTKTKKKATVEALIARAEQSKEDKIQLKEYYCEPLDMILLVKKPGVRKLAQMLDGFDDSDSVLDNIDANVEVIYESVPMFHNKELQEAYGCVEPTDIVLEVLKDNLSELEKLASFIMKMFGLAEEEVVNDLKN